MSKLTLKVAVPWAMRKDTNTRLWPGQPLGDSEAAQLVDQSTTPVRHQVSGNSGLNYAAWQLSRRGWHVMPTIRNARGSDLIVTDADETVFFGVQSKALGKRSAVPLGRDIDALRSDWWIVTIHANTENPICFILRLDEVRAHASQDKNGGAWWLEPRAYNRVEFRDAWDRLTAPIA